MAVSCSGAVDLVLLIFGPWARGGCSVHPWQFAVLPDFSRSRSPRGQPCQDRALDPSLAAGSDDCGRQGAPARGRAAPSSQAPPRAPGAGPLPTPCGLCCRCCARPGAVARAPSSSACGRERPLGPGRAAPWPRTARRSAASPTRPVTASSSVSTSQGPAARRHLRRPRRLPPPRSSGPAAVASRSRPPPCARGPAPSPPEPPAR